jgi:hypothetical protein
MLSLPSALAVAVFSHPMTQPAPCPITSSENRLPTLISPTQAMKGNDSLTRARFVAFALTAAPGLLFSALAALLQLLDGLDVRVSGGEGVQAVIAAAFFWVFAGPVVSLFAAVVGWFAIRRAGPTYRLWWMVVTGVSIGGWLLMVEFMRMS